MSRRWRIRLVVYSLIVIGLGVGFGWAFWTANPDRGKPGVVLDPTPPDAIDKMFELAAVTKDDVVFDLGSGDGRIPIAAAKKFGCRAVGVELESQLVELSRQMAREAGVEHLVEFRQGDIYDADVSQATVVALYLLPEMNMKLIPQLNRMKSGSRVVSYRQEMQRPSVDGTKMEFVRPRERVVLSPAGGRERVIFFWVTPLQIEER